MTKTELIKKLTDIEWEDFEVKESKSELPRNIWETVSALSNTARGWIVLGVKQKGKISGYLQRELKVVRKVVKQNR